MAGLPAAVAEWPAEEVEVAASRRRLRVQRALGVLWILDALLQLEPANFSRALVNDTILGNVENQPAPIAGSIRLVARLLEAHFVALNVAIVLVQLALGLALLAGTWVKPALACSVLWALGVWWFGEGFGGILAGEASLLVGAPGAAALYALVALAVWPVPCCGARSAAGVGLLGERALLGIWGLLWAGGALLRVIPFWFAPVYALQADLQNGLDGEPRWIFHANETLRHAALGAGLPLVIAMAALEASVGIGVLRLEHRRVALLLGGLLAALYWAIGQQYGGLLTSGATDAGSGPLYLLLAALLWPLSGRASSGDARDDHRLPRRREAAAFGL
ncbi:MAG TPA: hypothetical protein VGF95_03250 [Solirubrobacteraceae bacterium]|jgi:hypothetical protein